MVNLDLINGVFELFACVFIAASCYRAYADKVVRGVSLWHVGYFLLWAMFNMAFYPSLGQWFSFAGGCFILLANAVYAGMIFHYRRKEATDVGKP